MCKQEIETAFRHTCLQYERARVWSPDFDGKASQVSLPPNNGLYVQIMFPPRVEDAYKDTVYVAKEHRQSRSRQMLRDRCQPPNASVEKQLCPGEVSKFLRSLSADQILQVSSQKCESSALLYQGAMPSSL